MTVRVGANPTSQMYVGLQAGSTLSTRVASGTLPLGNLRLVGTTARRVYGSGAIDLPGPILELVHVHPVIRRGPGNLQLSGPTLSGSTHHIGVISAHDGILTLGNLGFAGTGLIRRFAAGDLALRFSTVGVGEVNGKRIADGTLTFSPLGLEGTATVTKYLTASGDLPLTLSLVGAGVRHLYVTATGDISLGTLTIHDIAPGQTMQIVPIEGTMLDPYLEGLFRDTIGLEGTIA